MSREILVLTPENIEIQYELAGVGTRLIANVFDQLLQIAVVLGLLFTVMAITALIAPSLVLPQAAFFIFVFFAIVWGYFIFFEMRWNGQTPGKRMMGIRVIRDGGYPADGYAVVVRNLLRVIDGMPVLLIVGFVYGMSEDNHFVADAAAVPVLITLICILLTSKYQRFGDMAAGTIVIRQRQALVKSLDDLAPNGRVMPEHLAAYALADISQHVDDMIALEYRAVRWYSDRRRTIPVILQQPSAMVLAVPLMTRLGIRAPDGVMRVNYADLLEYLAVAFEQRRGAA